MSIPASLRSGILINALGVVGKIAGPLFLVLVGRLYGPAAFGVFLTALVLVEMSIAFLTSGFQDGALLFAARRGEERDDAAEERLYRALANAFAWSALCSVVLIVLAFTVLPPLLRAGWSFGDALVPMVQWMVLGLPFFSFERNVVAATQGRRLMHWDALIAGGLRPGLLLLFALVLHPAGPEGEGLAMAFLITQVLCSAVAVVAFARTFDIRSLMRAFRPFRVEGDLVRFAVPQGLQMTLTHFMTGVDVLMLGLLGFSAAATGLYGIGAQIVRNLRIIKLTFSAAFAPHVPALLTAGDTRRLAVLTGDVSRWILLVGTPVCLLVAIFREELLLIVSSELAGEDTRFMLVLLLVPWLTCAAGLAHNIITMSGNARWNLLNVGIATAANVGLNLALVPPMGLAGAALASALATLLLLALQVAQVRRWLHVPLRAADILRPVLAGLLALTALAAGTLLAPNALAPLAQKALIAVATIAVYGAALLIPVGERIGRRPT